MLIAEARDARTGGGRCSCRQEILIQEGRAWPFGRREVLLQAGDADGGGGCHSYWRSEMLVQEGENAHKGGRRCTCGREMPIDEAGGAHACRLLPYRKR